MIDSYLRIIESFLTVYGIAAVFLSGIIEEVVFFIPLSLIFVATGFFIVGPELKIAPALLTAFWKVSLPGAIGIVFGGLVIYGLVYYGGKPLVRKFGKKVGLGWEGVEDLSNKFKKGRIDEAVLVFLRIIPLFPVGLVTIFCGFIRLGWWEFIWTTFVGSLIRLFGLSMLGWYLGKEYSKYVLQIAAFEKYLVFLVLLIVIGILIFAYKKHRQDSN
jgi:membrane protein DedA with SNARE-associated domain